MSAMRPLGILFIVLVLMVIFAGCGQRVPVRNTTPKPTWGQTPRPSGTAGPGVTVTPTTTGVLVEVTVMPTESGTVTPPPRPPRPPDVNITGNYTITDEKTLVMSYNRTAYVYNLTTPPLIIEYTLTVPTVKKTRVVTDPVTGGDKTVDIEYPDPVAWFEVTVRDLSTNRIVAQDGYGTLKLYSVDTTKKIWIRYAGRYYIEFAGNRLSARVKFSVPQVT